MAVLGNFLLAAFLPVVFQAEQSPVEKLEEQDMRDLIAQQGRLIAEQSVFIQELSNKVAELDFSVKELQNGNSINCITFKEIEKTNDQFVQNVTIEERVALLEIQVAEIDEDVTVLDTDVNFLFDEQIIQDERLLNLETTSDGVTIELAQINDEIEDLQCITVALDFRVTSLEENTGDGGNSSIAELEVRVEALEGITANQETRLITAEENIQGLVMTDVELDARVSDLEDNAGVNVNDTIAFHAVVATSITISAGDTVVFDNALQNEGLGYNSETGVFTVGSGAAGTYYFSTYLSVFYDEYGVFEIEVNNEAVCTAFGDQDSNTGTDVAQATCSAVAYVNEGDEIKVVYREGTDTTPLTFINSSFLFNGFNGFKL